MVKPSTAVAVCLCDTCSCHDCCHHVLFSPPWCPTAVGNTARQARALLQQLCQYEQLWLTWAWLWTAPLGDTSLGLSSHQSHGWWQEQKHTENAEAMWAACLESHSRRWWPTVYSLLDAMATKPWSTWDVWKNKHTHRLYLIIAYFFTQMLLVSFYKWNGNKYFLQGNVYS